MRRWLLLLLATTACGAPEAPPPTGGTDVEAGSCGRGLAVVSSDYQSTSVGLIDWEGTVLSSRFITSASADAGLSAPLSGDVVLPEQRQDGDGILVVDRTAGVLTRVGVASGEVEAQLEVRTGFSANPQDAFRRDGDLFVTRLNPDPEPGTEPFDGGSDLMHLVGGEIVERHDLRDAVPGEVLPRPTRMVELDGRLRVLLSAYDGGFSAARDSRIATLGEDGALLDVHVLEGLRGCSGMSAVPGGIVVACLGEFLAGASTSDLASSGLALLAGEGAGLVEARRWMASAIGDRPFGFSAAVQGGFLFAVTFGNNLGDSPVLDQLLALPLDGGAPEVIYESEADAFVLGEVRCPTDPSCGPCWLTDAEVGGLVPITSEGEPSVGSPVSMSDGLGLPPRTLGTF